MSPMYGSRHLCHPFNPSQGEAFCNCARQSGREVQCKCGEEEAGFEWTWDISSRSSAALLSNNNQDIKFHPEYSSGTAAVRGNTPLGRGRHYYWEIKMTTPVYGTDMMVGVGTSNANLQQSVYRFCSLLGLDGESWGLSYTGMLQHQGKMKKYGPRFGQGSIVGVHLDMWRGTLEYYLNRKPLGIAYEGLHAKELYPMVSSTAARSGMRVTCSRSFPSSLQFLCLQVLSQMVRKDHCFLQEMQFPPGLCAFIENNFWWMINTKLVTLSSRMNDGNQVRQQESDEWELVLDEEDELRNCSKEQGVDDGLFTVDPRKSSSSRSDETASSAVRRRYSSSRSDETIYSAVRQRYSSSQSDGTISPFIRQRKNSTRCSVKTSSSILQLQRLSSRDGDETASSTLGNNKMKCHTSDSKREEQLSQTRVLTRSQKRCLEEQRKAKSLHSQEISELCAEQEGNSGVSGMGRKHYLYEEGESSGALVCGRKCDGKSDTGGVSEGKRKRSNRTSRKTL